MGIRYIPSAMAAATLFLSPLAAGAQEIPTGTWTGTIAPPGSAPAEITYEVTSEADGFAIVVSSPVGPLPATDVIIADDRLTFTFEPGTPVDCTLMLQDNGSYEGECLDAGGVPGVLVMIPPDGE